MGRYLFVGILALVAGCKSMPSDAIGEANSLVISPGDPRVIDLARPATAPGVPLPEPQIIEAGERATLIYACRESRSDILAEAIDGLITPEGTVSSSSALNTLIVHDRKENVDSVLSVIRAIDRPTNQLLVEARVLEVTLDRDLEFEIRQRLTVPGGDSFFQSSDIVNLLTPGATPTVNQGTNLAIRSFAPGSVSLDTFVRLLLTRGKARILSSPNLIVSPGNEASIITGQEVPIQSVTAVGNSQSTTTQFKRVGIKLRVNLLQLTNDTARLELNPEVSNVTRFISTGSVNEQEIQNPIVAIRNVSSTLSLKDGEILTVGGLLSTEDRETIRGVPLLQDIPVLGNLFKSRRDQQVRTQVIFFLKVKIIPHGSVEDVRLIKPDGGFQKLDAILEPTSQPVTEP